MSALDRLIEADAVRRLWARDGSLFSRDPAVAASIKGLLGWVGLASSADDAALVLAEAAQAARRSGITDIVLLGMGGSSLAPLVLSEVLGGGEGAPRLHVLDTTSPYTVLRTIETLWPSTTLVVVSSKSGGTIEPNSLYAIFRQWAEEILGDEAGSHFIAITDPGSSLEARARADGFAAVFPGLPDVGGRFSALSAFGIVPASLAGIDVARLTASALEMEASCRVETGENPAAQLAAWIADCLESGRDKLTFLASEPLAPFGLWVEQLVAESTGKDETGVVPVLERAPGDARAWGGDRMLFVMRTPFDDELASVAARAPHGTPVLEIIIEDPYAIGGEFVRWEFATALTGHLMGVNPFDQPNVAEAKAATAAILEGTLAAPAPTMRLGDIAITTSLPSSGTGGAGTLAAAFDALLSGADTGSYLAVLAYLPEDREIVGPLADAVAALAAERHMACTLEIGPRYLHSTGQLHKAGPPTGRFIVVTTRDDAVVSVPGMPYTLGGLIRAQAEGDFVTLAKRGLPVVRVDLPQPAHGPVRLLAETLRGAGIG
ncbi:MAG: glucose-6-phosphate isomerase [Coriobacteriia bacterium]|nr:glucose-6-phosphate isomerase [Coriobacteriia bacterium]